MRQTKVSFWSPKARAPRFGEESKEEEEEKEEEEGEKTKIQVWNQVYFDV